MAEGNEVVLVEDSPDDGAFFAHTFEKAGFKGRLIRIPDGAEALEFFFCTGRHADRNLFNVPRLIILDLKLPKVSGLDVLRRLKGDPHTRTIPIVVLSSSQEERDLVNCYAFGVNSYIVKPMDFDQFEESVRVVCEYWMNYNQTPKP